MLKGLIIKKTSEKEQEKINKDNKDKELLDPMA